MARSLGVGNVRFVHGDLLDVARLDERFHVILCSGVLHHMADPAAGLRALTAVLEDGGVMKLGLYSERARSSIAAAREEIARRGLRPVPDDIRAFRQELLASQDDLGVLTATQDFYALSSCRDLLFHVQEHRFTPRQLAALLAGAGLEFLGFELPDLVLEQYRRRFPEDPRARDLERWDAYEETRQITESVLTFFARKPSPA